MGGFCSVRKKRKSETIDKCNKLFSKCIDEKDYKNAALVLYYNVLVDFAKRGILSALHDGNSLMIRKKIRRGL